MSKELLKSLIVLIDDNNIYTAFKFLIRLIPEDAALPDELEVLLQADQSILKNGLISHNDIQWD